MAVDRALLSAKHYPAANTAAVVNLAASGRKHRVKRIMWSYSDAPPAGTALTVEDGSGNVVRKIFITAPGPGVVSLDAVNSAVSTAMIITLPAGGADISGTLDVEYTDSVY